MWYNVLIYLAHYLRMRSLNLKYLPESHLFTGYWILFQLKCQNSEQMHRTNLNVVYKLYVKLNVVIQSYCVLTFGMNVCCDKWLLVAYTLAHTHIYNTTNGKNFDGLSVWISNDCIFLFLWNFNLKRKFYFGFFVSLLKTIFTIEQLTNSPQITNESHAWHSPKYRIASGAHSKSIWSTQMC